MSDDNKANSITPPIRDGISTLIGTLTIIWNVAQEKVFHLFQRASRMPKPMAEAVFFSLRSDSSQRQITRAVCRETTLMTKEWKDDVMMALAKFDEKSGERNAFIHTMWDQKALFAGFVAPSTGISPLLHHKKLADDLIKQLQVLIVDAMKIDAYLTLSLKRWDDAQLLRDSSETQAI